MSFIEIIQLLWTAFCSYLVYRLWTGTQSRTARMVSFFLLACVLLKWTLPD